MSEDLSKEQRSCPSCGVTIGDDLASCPNCGVPLEQRAASITEVRPAVRPSDDKILLERLIREPGDEGVKPIALNKLAGLLLGVIALAFAMYFITQKEEKFAEAPAHEHQSDGNHGMSAADSLEMLKQMLVVNTRIDSLEHHLETRSNDNAARLMLANLLYDTRQWDRARDEYARYLKSDPKNVAARVDYGFAITQATNDPAKGVAEIEKGLKYDPTHVNALFNAGILSLQMTGSGHKGALGTARKYFVRAKAAATHENPELVPQIDRILAEMDSVQSKVLADTSSGQSHDPATVGTTSKQPGHEGHDHE